MLSFRTLPAAAWRRRAGDIGQLCAIGDPYTRSVSQASAQAAQFFDEVADSATVWMVRGSGGLPTVPTPQGPAVPFWSSRARAAAIVAAVPAYRSFEPVQVTWTDFRDRWLPDLAREGLRIGVNWTGKTATGYDFEASTVQERIEAAMARSDGQPSRDIGAR
jgi:hypothetical protein